MERAYWISIGFLSEALSARGLKFGKLMVTKSVQLQGRTAGGIEYGTAGEVNLRMSKLICKQLFANPYETLEVADSLARHYVCLLFALRDESMRGWRKAFPCLYCGIAAI